MVKPTTPSTPITLQSLVRSTAAVPFSNFVSLPTARVVEQRPRRITLEDLSRIIDEALAISDQCMEEMECERLDEIGRARDPQGRQPQGLDGNLRQSDNKWWQHHLPPGQ